jgi:HAD superfamily hydrolase (TIGR01544 family)
MDVMQQWYAASEELAVSTQFTVDQIREHMDQQPLILRNGVTALLNYCKDYGVDCYIISAGLGDLIVNVLQPVIDVKNCDNIHVISNFMVKNDKDVIVGFTTPMITPPTKNLILNKKLLPSLKKNTILIGDVITDLKMAENVNSETLISIGYLNKKPELVDQYLKSFDIVILNDGDFHYPLACTQYALGIIQMGAPEQQPQAVEVVEETKAGQ